MHKLDVYFLGQFKVVLDDRYEINYGDIGSMKNAKLLAYLLKNYKIKLSGFDIQGVMFSDDSSNNPSNALKALVYRLRTILKKFLGSDIDIIISGNGTYFINPELQVNLDIDIFDDLIISGNHENEVSNKIKKYEAAIDYYKGPFLPMFSSEQWVVISATYLESAFMTTVTYLLKYYLEIKQYELVERLSKQALDYDPLNERLHYYLIKALKRQDKQSLAKQHYLNTEKFLFDELGIHPSEELQQLYEELISNQSIKEVTMNEIQNGIVESTISGAFQCSYKTFKKIYQLDVRKAIRNGISEYLVLLTLEVKDHVSKNSDIVEAVIESTSSLLNQTILATLRSGDTFSKYSNQQYLILLPDCNDDNARKVVERITKNFYQLDKYQRVNIISKIDEIRLSGGNENGELLSTK